MSGQPQPRPPRPWAVAYQVSCGDKLFWRYKPRDIEAAKHLLRLLAPGADAAVARRPSVARFAQTYAARTLQVSPAALAREHNLPEFSFPNNDSNPTNHV